MKRPLVEKHLIENKTTFSNRLADQVTDFVGSWKFIIFQSILFTIWVSCNIYFLSKPFDAYPFIFLNLVMGLETVYTTPLIMMSQNRQEQRDRVRDDADFEADMNAAENIKIVRQEVEDLKIQIADLKNVIERKSQR